MLGLENPVFRQKTVFSGKFLRKCLKTIKKVLFGKFRKIPVFLKKYTSTTPQLFSNRLRGWKPPTPTTCTLIFTIL